MYHSKVLATSFSNFNISVSKKQMTTQKIWNVLKSYQAPPGNPSRSEDMSVILWIFKISAAGYNFLRRSRQDIGGEFHLLFGQHTGKRSFYYWLPPCDSSLPEKKIIQAGWTKKSSLMIVWCQNKSKWPFILIIKPSRKRLFLSFTAVLWHIRYRDLHHHDGRDFPSFLLKTRPARHPVQYFFLSAFCSGRKKQSQKRAFKGKYQSCSISGMGDIEKTPVFDMIGGYRCLLSEWCGEGTKVHCIDSVGSWIAILCICPSFAKCVFCANL